ncbi:Ataxin-10 [Blastocladiella emersonii ATCC 22665]|nr:Ataxin-10 [Blastocladiella emersonii ATCC 22665]
MEQFVEDLNDFCAAAAGSGPDDRELARSILVDLAADLGQLPEARKHLGQSEEFWRALNSFAAGTASSGADIALIASAVRNACIECPAAQSLAIRVGCMDVFLCGTTATLIRSSWRHGEDADPDSAPDAEIATSLGTVVEAASNLCAGNPAAAEESRALHPDPLSKWTVDLLSFPVPNVQKKAMVLALVLLTQRLLPVHRPHTVGDRPSPGVLVLERVFLIAAAKPGASIVDVLLSSSSAADDDDSDGAGGDYGLSGPFASASPSSEHERAPQLNPVDPLLVIEELRLFDVVSLTSQPPELLAPTIQLLCFLNDEQPRATMPQREKQQQQQQQQQPTDQQESVYHGIFGTKKLLILILAQLVTDHRANQDAARELGGLQLVLNHCNYDDNHPYIREYAIYCLSALLKYNAENQAVVNQLKAMDVADSTTEMLEELKIDSSKLRERILKKGTGQ